MLMVQETPKTQTLFSVHSAFPAPGAKQQDKQQVGPAWQHRESGAAEGEWHRGVDVLGVLE